MTTTDDSPADAHNDDCPICMGPVQDPLTVDCGGGHRFCRRCAERWRTQSRSCAVCRQAVTNVTLEIEIDMDRHDNIGYLTRQLAEILHDLGLPPDALRAAANRMEVARLEADAE